MSFAPSTGTTVYNYVGATILVSGSPVTLQTGSVNTTALVPNASGGFQLINLPRCS